MTTTFALTVMAMPHLSGWAMAALVMVSAVAGYVAVREAWPETSSTRLLIGAVAASGLAALFLVVPALYATILVECGLFGCWFDTLFW